MNIVDSYILFPRIDGKNILKRLERYGRVCYKSEEHFKLEDSSSFIKMLLEHKHESVLEHEKLTFLMVCDRGVSHELVRHRIASYSQESTRYCNYQKDKFGSELTFIKPNFFTEKTYEIWRNSMEEIERVYFELLTCGASPQEARSILPSSLKTEIVVTMNFRALRNFLKLRADKAAHPQIREIAIPLLLYLKKKLPELFFDINFDSDLNCENYSKIIETNEFFKE